MHPYGLGYRESGALVRAVAVAVCELYFVMVGGGLPTKDLRTLRRTPNTAVLSNASCMGFYLSAGESKLLKPRR